MCLVYVHCMISLSKSDHKMLVLQLKLYLKHQSGSQLNNEFSDCETLHALKQYIHKISLKKRIFFYFCLQDAPYKS